MCIGPGLALALWAESDSKSHLWNDVAFLAPFAFFGLCGLAGVYLIAALFLKLPLPTLLHEREAKRRADMASILSEIRWRGICLHNDPDLSREEAQEWSQEAVDFLSVAFGPLEATQLMSATMTLGESPTRYDFVQAHIDRLGQVADRSHLLPISPFFTRQDWEKLVDFKRRMSEANEAVAERAAGG